MVTPETTVVAEPRWKWWKWALLLLALAVIVPPASFVVWKNTRPNFAGLLAWAEVQPLTANQSQTLPLPGRLTRGIANGVAEVARLNDGTVVMLVKTSIGWKQNFEGYVISSRRLPESAFYTDYYGRRCIDVDKADAVIDRQLDETTFLVYFDLG
jgi:hypothetical protein